MTEVEAKQLLLDAFGALPETLSRLSEFVSFLREENNLQNLVSRTTLDQVWTRHILDSAQLVRFAPDARTWLDLGTGAGFPGLIVAAIHPASVTMIESRPLRAAFLRRAADVLKLPAKTSIICGRVEAMEVNTFDAISARAFAPLDRLFEVAHRFAAPETRWVLPKGRSAQTEVDQVRNSWQGMFHVEPSLTDPEAGIIIAEQVARRFGSKQGR